MFPDRFPQMAETKEIESHNLHHLFPASWSEPNLDHDYAFSRDHVTSELDSELCFRAELIEAGTETILEAPSSYKEIAGSLDLHINNKASSFHDTIPSDCDSYALHSPGDDIILSKGGIIDRSHHADDADLIAMRAAAEDSGVIIVWRDLPSPGIQPWLLPRQSSTELGGQCRQQNSAVCNTYWMDTYGIPSLPLSTRCNPLSS
jgi:hypothetical protein